MKKESAQSKTKESMVQLMNVANRTEVFHTSEGRLFAVAEVKGRQEVLPLESDEFQGWLKALYYETQEQFPKQAEINNVLSFLKNKARSKKRRIYIRTARTRDAIYIDLCNKERQTIKISPTGWKILKNSKTLFYRPKGMKFLPKPVKSNNRAKVILKFNSLINASRNDSILIRGWLLGALMPGGPYPILVLLGESGSGKSIRTKILKELVDPSTLSLRSLPADEHDLAITCQNNLVLTFDNISKIPLWLSDEFCRLSTGGGISYRKLYEDYGEVIFDYKRPIILNSISNPISKNDLADRALVITMEPFESHQREREEEIWKEFKKYRGILLGVLLDAMSASLRNRDRIRRREYPRMADFMHAVDAAGTSLFETEDEFVKAYENSMKMQSRVAIESDLVGIELEKLVKKSKDEWTGTPTELLRALEKGISIDDKDRTIRDRSWPKHPNFLSARIRELSPDLRKLGYNIEQKRTSQKRIIHIFKERRRRFIEGVVPGE